MSLGLQDILERFYFSIQNKILDHSFLFRFVLLMCVCLGLWVELVWDQAWGSCWNWRLGQNLYSYIVLLLESWLKATNIKYHKRTDATLICRAIIRVTAVCLFAAVQSGETQNSTMDKLFVNYLWLITNIFLLSAIK